MTELPQADAEPTIAQLLKSVNELTAIVAVLADRFARKRLSDTVLAVVVAAVVLLGSLYYFVELPSRRADTRGQIRNLACYAVRLRPPGYSPTSDALRVRYRCPPYDPSVAGATTAPASAPASRRPSTGDASTPATSGRAAQRPSATPTALPSTGARPTARRTPAASTAPRINGSSPTSRGAVAPTGGRDASPPPLVRLPTISLCIAGLGICPPG